MIDLFERQSWKNYELETNEGFLDASVYTRPANSEETRKQLQSQHSQLQDYINGTLVPTVNQTATDLEENYYTKWETMTRQEVYEEIATVTGTVSKGYVDTHDEAVMDYAVAADGNITGGVTPFSKLTLGSNHVIDVTDSDNNHITFSIIVEV